MHIPFSFPSLLSRIKTFRRKATPLLVFRQDIHKFWKSRKLKIATANFARMGKISWVQLNEATSYCLHNQYLLMKRKVKGYFVFSIWQNNVMIHSCYNEYQFGQLAQQITNGLFSTAG